MGACIFISHARHDRAYVKDLAAHLTDAGIPVWYDRDIIAGDRWTQKIEDQIDACAALIVVMSPASAKSEWVDREIIHAENRGKTIVPLLLDGTVFFHLNNIKYHDVTGGRLPPGELLDRLRGLVRRKDASTGIGSRGDGMHPPRRVPAPDATWTFDPVWYLEGAPETRVAVMTSRFTGRLSVSSTGAVFESRQHRVRIAKIHSVTIGPAGADTFNSWVRVVHGDADNPSSAYFAGAAFLGWGGLLGGTKKIYAALKALEQPHG
jgi:hypothetical protein